MSNGLHSSFYLLSFILYLCECLSRSEEKEKSKVVRWYWYPFPIRDCVIVAQEKEKSGLGFPRWATYCPIWMIALSKHSTLVHLSCQWRKLNLSFLSSLFSFPSRYILFSVSLSLSLVFLPLCPLLTPFLFPPFIEVLFQQLLFYHFTYSNNHLSPLYCLEIFSQCVVYFNTSNNFNISQPLFSTIN